MTSGFSDVGAPFEYPEPLRPARRTGVLAAAAAQGWAGAKDRTISGRLPSALIEAAKARSGIASDSELLTYALAKVALEDEFGPALLARKGSVPKDVALDV
jgi:hypothetical protein